MEEIIKKKCISIDLADELESAHKNMFNFDGRFDSTSVENS